MQLFRVNGLLGFGVPYFNAYEIEVYTFFPGYLKAQFGICGSDLIQVFTL